MSSKYNFLHNFLRRWLSVPLSFCPLFFCSVLVFTVKTAVAETLLTEAMRSTLVSSKVIETTALEDMRYTPRFIFSDDSRYFGVLDQKQREQLVTLLEKSPLIDPKERLSQCQFLPGAVFDFYSDELPVQKAVPFREVEVDSPKNQLRVASVALCFNCDVWAIALHDDKQAIQTLHALIQPNAAAVSRYGDLRQSRAELLEFLRSIPVLKGVADKVSAASAK